MESWCAKILGCINKGGVHKFLVHLLQGFDTDWHLCYPCQLNNDVKDDTTLVIMTCHLMADDVLYCHTANDWHLCGRWFHVLQF